MLDADILDDLAEAYAQEARELRDDARTRERNGYDARYEWDCAAIAESRRDLARKYAWRAEQ